MTQQEFSMKVHIKTVVSGVLITLIVLTFFSACSNIGLFSSIEKEVKLYDPTMRGIITSLEVVKGNIYVTNEMLYQRTGGTDAWVKILPSGAERCAEVASDGTYLYARFTTSDPAVLQSVKRYDPSSENWTNLTGVDNVARISSGNNRIYAFTGIDNSYKAYITTAAGSTVINATPIATDIATPTGTVGNYISTTKKVYSYDGTTFAELGGADKSPSGITGITVKGTNVYAVNSGYVWRFDTVAAAWTSIAHEIITPTTNIAYLGTGGKNLLLVGSGASSGGFGEVILTADGALSSVIGHPGDTAASSITTDASTQYKNSVGLWAVYRIFAVTTSVPSGNDYVIYASVANSTYDGLWSYYSGTRNEWNRE